MIPPDPQSDGRIRAVLVGTGGIARAWAAAPAFRELVQPVGLVNRTVAKAASFAAEVGLSTVPISGDLAEMLGLVRPEAVFDCTNSESHPDVTCTAVAAGCHVLVEKPLADDLSGAQRMVSAAEAAGKLLVVAQTQRYQPIVERISAILGSGALGTISEWHADLNASARFGGFRDALPHALLSDMSIHTCDLARAFGFGHCSSVLARSWNPAGSWFASGASACAIFTDDQERTFTFRGTWAATGHTGSWRGVWRIHGSRGTLLWDGGDRISLQTLEDPEQPSLADGGQLVRRIRDEALPEASPKSSRAGHDAAIAAFCSALRGGPLPPTVGRANLASLEMMHGALAAVRGNGRWQRD